MAVDLGPDDVGIPKENTKVTRTAVYSVAPVALESYFGKFSCSHTPHEFTDPNPVVKRFLLSDTASSFLSLMKVVICCNQWCKDRF